MIDDGDTTIDLMYSVINVPYTTTPTATTPDQSTLATAAGVSLIGGQECDYGLCPNVFSVGDANDIANSAQTIYTYTLQSGFENDGSYFEVGDTIDIWSIDTDNGNTHTEAFELAGSSSLFVAVSVSALVSLSMI